MSLYDNYRGQFSFVIVPDIEKEDAFDEAVKGVDGVVHTASPFHVSITFCTASFNQTLRVKFYVMPRANLTTFKKLDHVVFFSSLLRTRKNLSAPPYPEQLVC